MSKVGALGQVIKAGRAAFLEKNAQLQSQAAIIKQLQAADLAEHLKTGLPASTYIPSDSLQQQIQSLQVPPPKFKNGGHVTQPSKMNNTFMAGGLNLINPKNKTKGPLNVQWNSNNLIASSRAK